MPHQGPHVQQAALGARRAREQGDRRGLRAGRLPGGLPVDDRQGHLRDQRRRARRRVAARALAGRVLHGHRRPDDRPTSLLRQAHPEPRRVARVRDVEQGRHVGEGRPKRKLPVTTLLRAVGYSSNEEIKVLFTAIDNDPEHQYVQSTLDRDPTTNTNEGLVEVYKRLRPGDPPTIDNARNLVQSLFFNFRRYDLAKVGRYKLNRKLGLDLEMSQRTLTNDDLVRIVGRMVELNNGKGNPDDIDHLGNRRVRAVGELIKQQFRVGLLRMERVVRERMSIVEPEKATPKELI